MFIDNDTYNGVEKTTEYVDKWANRYIYLSIIFIIDISANNLAVFKYKL